MPRQRYARAIALTIALSTRVRGGAHALVPSGASMILRPPRLRIRSGMSTVSVAPWSLRPALVMLPSAHTPDRDAHAIHRPASSVLPCASAGLPGPGGARLARREAERCVPARRGRAHPRADRASRALGVPRTRSDAECKHSAWVSDGREMARLMGKIFCHGGYTQIRKALQHVKVEHQR